MISAALFAISVGSHSNPLIAYSCRFYYPAGDKRTSYHQIYLSDIQGSNRRQLTFDNSEKRMVRWVGKNKLAWVESNGVTKRETWLGYHMPTGANGEVPMAEKLVLYNLKTKVKRVVEEGNFNDEPAQYSLHVLQYRRGMAVYFGYKSVLGEKEWDIKDTHCTVITSKTVRKPEAMPNPVHGFFDTENPPPDPWSVIKFDKDPKGSSKGFKYGGPKGYSTDFGTQFITKRGKTVFVPIGVDYVWNSTDGLKCWFQVASYAGSAGSDQWIYEINWKTGLCRLMADTVLDIDFDPNSRYWAASSNNKGIAMIGKKAVWSRELWVGDVKTRKQWKITSSAVHGDGAVVQPES